MAEAAWWGFVGGASLLLGALVGAFAPVPRRVIGIVMAFGAGVLVSAVAFELTEEAFRAAGGWSPAAGLIAGSLTFFAGDWAIDARGGHRRKSPVHGGVRRGENPLTGGDDASADTADAADTTTGGATGSAGGGTAGAGSSAGLALILGALLDGIPESAAIGVSLLGGEGVGAAMVAAVFLSNVPESVSATTGLRASGRSTRWILGLWASVVVASTLAAVAGYALLGDASPSAVAFIQTFAAGAILTMLADTMVPEATEHAGRLVGLFTVLGFAVAFLLSATT